MVQSPHRTLSLLDAVCIIVGTIIGAGIFRSASDVAGLAGNTSTMVCLWIAAGFIVLVGAACFIELTTRFPDEPGGDYVYLKRAYGHPLAFMFAWASFWIVRPANIGIMAVVFAEHFAHILTPWTGVEFVSEATLKIACAVVAVTGLTAANLIGIQNGKRTQNVLTIAKVAGICLIILLAFTHPYSGADSTTDLNSQPAAEVVPDSNAPEDSSADVPPADSNSAKSGSLVSAFQSLQSLWLPLVLVMFTFGGWNDVALVAAEIKQPKRNLWRALIFGIGIVTLVYVTFNIALVTGLGYENMAASKSAAIDLVGTALGKGHFLGDRSKELIAALVCISCLGAINGMILTSPRIYYAVGRDYPAFRFLSGWDQARNCPWQAIILQAIVTLLLIGICSRYEKVFLILVVASAPYFWSFLGVTVLSLIVFRRRDGQAKPNSHFRLPLFPLEPIFFAVFCAGLTWNSIQYLIGEGYSYVALAIGVLMIVGVLLGLVLKPKVDSAVETNAN
jgi:amino acid transporter